MSAVFTNSSFGQNETLIYKKIADSFKSNYNSDNFEAIFSSFSTEMQKALPRAKTNEFLHGLKNQAEITAALLINVAAGAALGILLAPDAGEKFEE